MKKILNLIIGFKYSKGTTTKLYIYIEATFNRFFYTDNASIDYFSLFFFYSDAVLFEKKNGFNSNLRN